MESGWCLLPNSYLFRLDHLGPLHIHQLAHSVLDGVELPAVAGRVEAVGVCLLKGVKQSAKSMSKIKAA